MPVFITWRLNDSPETESASGAALLDTEKGSANLDGLPGRASGGACYLRQPAIAEMVMQAFHENADRLGHYTLHAFVIMPDHVHLLLTPLVPLAELSAALKGITEERAHAMLALPGQPFWREDGYSCVLKQEWEVDKLQAYIEGDPVRAELVQQASEYRWSSAGSAPAAQLLLRGPSDELPLPCTSSRDEDDLLAAAG